MTGGRGDVTSYRLNWLTALPAALVAAGIAAAWQSPLSARPTQGVGGADPAPAAQLGDDEVDFIAGQLLYAEDANTVTAIDDVRMTRQGYRLRADKVIWNRTSGAVRAEGNVAIVSPQGDTAYGDSVDLTDTLKDGVVENLLLVLDDGGRLAARHGVRNDGVTTFDYAAYTPCRVTEDHGCPRRPIWKITAVRVIHDPARHRIYYKNATLDVLGIPILALPRLSHPDGSGKGGSSGLLVPDARYSNANGLELSVPYYWQIAPNRDLTLTPHIYSSVLPMMEAQYRALTSRGAFQITGFGTYGSRLPATTTGAGQRSHDFRGYLDANGKLQLDPYWSINASLRRTTDRTFLRRYDISRDDRLRSVVEAERVDNTSYLSIAGWSFQGLRNTDRNGQMPIVLPAIDYRKRIEAPVVGGRIALQANSLSIIRTGGQDTQRAFAAARWDVRRVTPIGQELTLTAYARGDVYHTQDVTSTVTPIYRGTPGWHTRGIGALAADMRWPLIGPMFGGLQRITPRVQIVASPPTENLDIPNEDARAIDLEDSNLFALNRFAGYDRWEDGTRITYGAEYALDLPRFSLVSTIGQSYRLTREPSLFPEGTGLTRRHSDIVGRTTIKYGRWLTLAHRYRLDKNSLAVRRSETNAAIGSDVTYLALGYLRLNRDISPLIEDLRDREEIRLGGRVQVQRYWSVFGASVIDLTGRREDPLSNADGYDPLQHQLGVEYLDDCFNFQLVWRRDYDRSGDARRGDSFRLRLALRNLGR